MTSGSERAPGATKTRSAPEADELLAAVRAEAFATPGSLPRSARVPRAEFVPLPLADRAYSDDPVPTGHGQVTTQPSLVARMVEALELTGRERVLEIGTGYGWQTALLARLAASVWSVDRWPEFAERAPILAAAAWHRERRDRRGRWHRGASGACAL